MNSATNPFHLVAQFFQLGHNPFTLVALDFDFPILDRAPCPTTLLQDGGKILQFVFIQRGIEDSRHPFSPAARSFPANFEEYGLEI